MANRKDIKEAFLKELRRALKGTVSEDRVVLGNASDITDYPTVAYQGFGPTRLSINEGSRGVSGYKTDASGNRTNAKVKVKNRLTFDVVAKSGDEIELEDIYSDITDHFQRYSQLPTLSSRDFHDDCFRLIVTNNVDETDAESEDTIWGDRLTIEADYVKVLVGPKYEPIDTVELDLEGNTYTTD